MPQISINGTSLNAVEHFTYLGSIFSNDAAASEDPVSQTPVQSQQLPWKTVKESMTVKEGTTGSFTPSLHKELSSVLPSYSVQRSGSYAGRRSGSLSMFTSAVYDPFLASNGKTECQTKKSSSEPACPA